MSTVVEIEKEFEHRCERVKSLDIHPTKPWILLGLHAGTERMCIWNYEKRIMEKSVDISQSPVRSAKFIVRKEWIVAGSDDHFIRVYEYNTMEKVKEFEAHTDYIRSIAVHPSLPYILSASDDHVTKLWDWESDWDCLRTFDGHAHYVMKVTFNPNDPDFFATASLDSTVKLWNIGSPNPHSTLEGHSKGINCVDFFSSGGKQFLITGSDDFTAKIWDYEAKTCVETLEGHTNNVTAVCVLSEIHVIVTGSEDGTIRIWDMETHRMEYKLDSGLGRVWDIGFVKGSPKIVLGCDDGIVFGKLIESPNPKNTSFEFCGTSNIRKED